MAAAGAVFGLREARSARTGPAGDILLWTDQASKEAVQNYLNAHVTVDGFKVKVATVSRGQNYWGLAREAGINIDSLVGYNPDMEHFNAYIGRVLLLGNKEGALHQVKPGETLEDLEKLYKLEPGALRKANRIGWLGLRPGQVLFVPGVSPKQMTAKMAELFEGRDFIRSPLAGHYSSLEGYRVDPFTGEKRLHNGVDIKAPFNSLVAAAADGKVVLAGWNSGFGKCIIIDHDNGFRTLYGHLNVILVHVGERVKQYQYIGKVGKTGRTTGPHLHFTVWKNGKIQNPLKYLW